MLDNPCKIRLSRFLVRCSFTVWVYRFLRCLKNLNKVTLILKSTWLLICLSVYQATLVASAVTLSSTTATAHTLMKCKLRETAYGKTIIELMAVQVAMYCRSVAVLWLISFFLCS